MGLGDQDTAAVFEVLKKTISHRSQTWRSESGIAFLHRGSKRSPSHETTMRG